MSDQAGAHGDARWRDDELERLRGRVNELERLVVEHHAAGAMDGALPGDECPVCRDHAPEREPATDEQIDRSFDANR